MSKTWDERAKAIENEYFERLNQQALERLRAIDGGARVRKSPVTGEPMVQKAFMGVIVDQCPTSGGIWLDGGELEEILKHVDDQSVGPARAVGFLGRLFGKK
jgi:Transcription factor zinc-finger